MIIILLVFIPAIIIIYKKIKKEKNPLNKNNDLGFKNKIENNNIDEKNKENKIKPPFKEWKSEVEFIEYN